MVISRTPFRISFFGGGTDYPGWYKKNGGAVLATTINKYCYLTARYLPPFFDKYRIIYRKIERRKDINKIEHAAVREIIKYLKIKDGLEIHHDGDLPARSGIGSSSAFTVGLLNALHALKGSIISKHTLAKESIFVEQKILKETVGSQDQVLAAHGGLKHVVFQNNGEMLVKPVTITNKRIKELENHLMLFYTGIRRTASEVAKTYVENIETKKQQLDIMRQFVDDALNILDSKRDIQEFGKLMHEAWEVKRTLSNKVTNPTIDKLYLDALSCGVLGGKITGAGGGGFLLLFTPPKHQKKVLEKFRKLVHVPFKFEDQGSQIIFYDDQDKYKI